MAKYSENYKLVLPEESEQYNIKIVNDNNTSIDRIMSDNSGGNLDNKNHLTEIQNDLLAYKSTVSNTYETKLNATAHKDNIDNPHLVTKEQVGLGSVENVALSGHTGRKDNPHFVTKAQVGLGNVDNTADLDKPIPTSAQQELDLKENINNFADLGYISSGQVNPNTGGSWRINLSNFPTFIGMTSNIVNILQYGSGYMVTQLLTNNIDKIVFARTRLISGKFAAWNSDWVGIGTNATTLNGKTEGQLSVATAKNGSKLNGKDENNLSVNSARSISRFGVNPNTPYYENIAEDVTYTASYDGYIIARSDFMAHSQLNIWINDILVVATNSERGKGTDSVCVPVRNGQRYKVINYNRRNPLFARFHQRYWT